MRNEKSFTEGESRLIYMRRLPPQKEKMHEAEPTRSTVVRRPLVSGADRQHVDCPQHTPERWIMDSPVIYRVLLL